LKKAVEEVVSVTRSNPITVSTFLDLGRDYFKDLPAEQRGKFMESILARQEERDRWLLLLKHKREYVGFAHVKIDKDERPGWGFVLEFYIAPDKRRIGLGCTFFNIIEEMLRSKAVKDVWLLSRSSDEALAFWSSLGFKLSGEIDEETGQSIMEKSLALNKNLH
jgi:N-acetylglutamate synthase-like GNAT family acetyltransferase